MGPHKFKHLISIFLLVITTSCYSDDLSDGISAYENENYVAALNKLEPLAEQGVAEA